MKRKNQLTSATEHMMATQLQNPYALFSISMRSKSDLIVARYLLDALNANRKDQNDLAERRLSEAKKLAPEYFEVHRCEAWIKAQQGNTNAARDAYETAIELEPKNAPLRCWYGGFLLRRLNDTSAAIEQFRTAMKIDPSSSHAAIELARCHLYKSEFSESRQILDGLIKNEELLSRDQRIIRDLDIQFYHRRAEWHIEQQDFVIALESYEQFRSAFESCPVELMDKKMTNKLQKAYLSVNVCHDAIEERFPNKVLSKRSLRLVEWIDQRLDITDPRQTADDVGLMSSGSIKELTNKGYGFINDQNGQDFFSIGTIFVIAQIGVDYTRI